MRMCDKTYNVLKWMAQLLLPAMGTLYFALASIWRLPYGEQVVGTITAVDTFLGVILGITTAQYKQKQKTDNFIWMLTNWPASPTGMPPNGNLKKHKK